MQDSETQEFYKHGAIGFAAIIAFLMVCLWFMTDDVSRSEFTQACRAYQYTVVNQTATDVVDANVKAVYAAYPNSVMSNNGSGFLSTPDVKQPAELMLYVFSDELACHASYTALLEEQQETWQTQSGYESKTEKCIGGERSDLQTDDACYVIMRRHRSLIVAKADIAKAESFDSIFDMLSRARSTPVLFSSAD